jgi:type III secretory pathway component EscT
VGVILGIIAGVVYVVMQATGSDFDDLTAFLDDVLKNSKFRNLRDMFR